MIVDNRIKMRAMKYTVVASSVLMIIKFSAYFITHSNAILTDALESIINVIAGAFALYSLYIASKPADLEHPYGHGKVEFFSAGFEGGLILIAGLSIIIKSVYAFFYPTEVHSLDKGALIAGIAGLLNYFLGKTLVSIGKKHQSILMIADGKHLISDTVSSIGMIVGLLIVYFTGWMWLDNVIAIVFGGFILFTGYKLLKQSVTDLLDEADFEKLNELTKVLNENRHINWIDIHNLRVIKYGSQLHIDSHITLPWFMNLQEVHKEVAAVEALLKKYLGNDTELFIHSDPCLPDSCSLCAINDCPQRKNNFISRPQWTLDNMLPNEKHRLD